MPDRRNGVSSAPKSLKSDVARCPPAPRPSGVAPEPTWTNGPDHRDPDQAPCPADPHPGPDRLRQRHRSPPHQQPGLEPPRHAAGRRQRPTPAHRKPLPQARLRQRQAVLQPGQNRAKRHHHPSRLVGKFFFQVGDLGHLRTFARKWFTGANRSL